MLKVLDSPYVLLAKDVCVLTPASYSVIDSIYVSPAGKVLVSGDLSDNIKDVISSWTISDLNNLSSDYYYYIKGQAFYAIDLLARRGYLSYKGLRDFERKVNICLSSRRFQVIKEAV